MKLNPSIKNMSNEYIFFTDQTALTFRICLVSSAHSKKKCVFVFLVNYALGLVVLPEEGSGLLPILLVLCSVLLG